MIYKLQNWVPCSITVFNEFFVLLDLTINVIIHFNVAK